MTTTLSGCQSATCAVSAPYLTCKQGCRLLLSHAHKHASAQPGRHLCSTPSIVPWLNYFIAPRSCFCRPSSPCSSCRNIPSACWIGMQVQGRWQQDDSMCAHVLPGLPRVPGGHARVENCQEPWVGAQCSLSRGHLRAPEQTRARRHQVRLPPACDRLALSLKSAVVILPFCPSIELYPGPL